MAKKVTNPNISPKPKIKLSDGTKSDKGSRPKK